MIVAAAVVDIFDLLPRRSPRNIEARREYPTASARQQSRELRRRATVLRRSSHDHAVLSRVHSETLAQATAVILATCA
jgi:hypothetical protein